MFYNHLISYNFFICSLESRKTPSCQRQHRITQPFLSSAVGRLAFVDFVEVCCCFAYLKRQRHEIFNPRHDSSPSGPIIHMRMYFYTWFRFRGNIFAYLFDFAEIFAYLKNSALSMTPHNFFCMTALGQSCFLLTSGSF